MLSVFFIILTCLFYPINYLNVFFDIQTLLIFPINKAQYSSGTQGDYFGFDSKGRRIRENNCLSFPPFQYKPTDFYLGLHD